MPPVPNRIGIPATTSHDEYVISIRDPQMSFVYDGNGNGETAFTREYIFKRVPEYYHISLNGGTTVVETWKWVPENDFMVESDPIRMSDEIIRLREQVKSLRSLLRIQRDIDDAIDNYIKEHTTEKNDDELESLFTL